MGQSDGGRYTETGTSGFGRRGASAGRIPFGPVNEGRPCPIGEANGVRVGLQGTRWPLNASGGCS
jgi:hypothetical protein